MSATDLSQRLARLRGPDEPPRSMTARTLAALAANPGCGRRALLDAAGVDKAAVAERIGHPAPSGQSQFAIVRGLGFEARLRADGCRALAELVRAHASVPGGDGASGVATAAKDGGAEDGGAEDGGAEDGGAEDDTAEHGTEDGPAHNRPAGAVPAESAPEDVGPGGMWLPALAADDAAERLRLTREALAGAAAVAARGGWSLLDHPMVELDVAGARARLEPDAVVVRPDGSALVVEIKSFPVLDGAADPAKVGAAARQAAVYVLALRGHGVTAPDSVLLVCPKDFSNQPVGALVDVRRQVAVTSRQLRRMTRIDELAGALPADVSFDLRWQGRGRRREATADPDRLRASVDAVPAAYAPECLSTCELAYHCRAQARGAGAVQALGRGLRGELGGLTTVDQVTAVLEAAEPAGSAAGRMTGAPPEGTAGDATDIGEALTVPAVPDRHGGAAAGTAPQPAACAGASGVPDAPGSSVDARPGSAATAPGRRAAVPAPSHGGDASPAVQADSPTGPPVERGAPPRDRARQEPPRHDAGPAVVPSTGGAWSRAVAPSPVGDAGGVPGRGDGGAAREAPGAGTAGAGTPGAGTAGTAATGTAATGAEAPGRSAVAVAGVPAASSGARVVGAPVDVWSGAGDPAVAEVAERLREAAALRAEALGRTAPAGVRPGLGAPAGPGAGAAAGAGTGAPSWR